jgi:hypothetical protein
MKTRLKLFLDNLTPIEFNKAFANTNYFYKNEGDLPLQKLCENFSDALLGAFNWENSPEGHEYWANILGKNCMQEEVTNVATNDTHVDTSFIIEKMLAYNEIIGLAQGYLDVIVEYPERAEELAQNALEVIDLKYNETKSYAKRNN